MSHALSPERRPRVVVLVKRTSYRLFVEEERDARVKRLIADGDPTVRRMRRAHDDHEATVGEVTEALVSMGVKAEVLIGSRARIEGRHDLVVTVGGDGTLLAASHQVGPDTPVMGINSAPDHSVGFFCAAKKGEARRALQDALEGTLRPVVLTRMRVDKNGECLHRRVLNEALFCHRSPAATSRYILEVRGAPDAEAHVEDQKSSGLWIGPAAGSTAAQRSAGGRVLPLTSQKIQYVVREPYTPGRAPLTLTVGAVGGEGTLTLRNKMREAKLFLDGHHIVHDATLGDVLVLRRSDESLTVLGLVRKRR